MEPIPSASSAVRRVDGAVHHPPGVLLLGSGLTVVLTTVATALGASSFSTNDAADALVRALMVATPMIIALNALHQGIYRRYAALLYAGGILAFLSTLADRNLFDWPRIRDLDAATCGRVERQLAARSTAAC